VELVTGYAAEDTLYDLILEGAKKGYKSSYENWNYLLIGLHSCGDLSAELMNDFVGIGNIKGSLSVGCCYQLMGIKGLIQI
jgi:hypothetical protein